MRIKWIALCFLLGFIIVLDPTHTPAQFERKGGGGKKGDRNPNGGFPSAGGYGTPLPPSSGGVTMYAIPAGGGGGTAVVAPTVALPPQGGGGFPGGGERMRMDRGPGGGGFPGGGAFPGAGATFQPQGGGGFPGGGERMRMDRGPGGGGGFPGAGGAAFPQGGGAFPQGGGGGMGGRGMGDPGAMWDRISRGQDSINVNDPSNSWMKGMMERQGQTVPSDGIITKQVFMAEAQKRMGAASGSAPGAPMVMTLGSGSMGNDGRMTMSMSPDGRMSFNPGGGGGDRDRGAERLRDQDKDGDGRVSRAEADRQLQPNYDRIDRDGDGFITLDEYRGYYIAQNQNNGNDRDRNRDMMANWSGGGDMGMGQWGNRQDPRRETQEEKPVAIRYGHLPKDLPDWFDSYDSTKDGQVALHEWRKAGESIESFSTYDLNGDQLITADELLRYNRSQSEAQRIAAILDGTGGSSRPSMTGRGPGGRGPGGPPSTGIPVPGASLDPVTTSAEKMKVREVRDSEKNSDKGDKNNPGNNGPWGNGGKKNK